MKLLTSLIVVCVVLAACYFAAGEIRHLKSELQSAREDLADVKARAAIAKQSLTTPTAPIIRAESLVEEQKNRERLRLQLQSLLMEKERLAKAAGERTMEGKREQLLGMPVYLSSELDKGRQPRVNGAAQQRPVYPPKFRAAKQNGNVDLSFIVGIDGRVHDIRVVKSTDKAFEEAAIEALKSWTFVPGTHKGAAVNARIVLPVKFAAGGNYPENSRWF